LVKKAGFGIMGVAGHLSGETADACAMSDGYEGDSRVLTDGSVYQCEKGNEHE